MTETLCCPVCNSIDTRIISELKDMPSNIGILWQDRSSALSCSKGDITLVFCNVCGLIWNKDFDELKLEYSQAYDNSLHFSDVYQQYAMTQARHLVEHYQIKEKTVIEVGCGKGDFLMMLCDYGKNKGVGFDVSYESRELNSGLSERITFINDFYSEKYAHYQGNLICSRYVLEHIENPIKFLGAIHRSIEERSDALVYCEVPNVYLILERLSIWDIIYEHCLYFSPGSLSYLFEKCFFQIIEVAETFDDQFVTIVAAQPDPSKGMAKLDQSSDMERIRLCVDRFLKAYQDQLQVWRSKIQKYSAANKKIMLWGAGAKGVGFLNLLEIRDAIPYVVDINPHKHGKFIAGTGQEIVSPDFIKMYQPDLVIVMNPVYKNEIKEHIKKLGGSPEIMTM